MKRILFIVAIFATVSLTSCTAPSTSDSSQVQGPDTSSTMVIPDAVPTVSELNADTTAHVTAEHTDTTSVGK